MDPGEAAAGEHRATLQSPLKITTALIVVTVAVLGNAVTSIIVAVAAGAAAGAAAGIAILQSLWEAGARTGAVEVGVTAVTGGLAGTTAAILQSLLGAQSLTGSAVTGALAGAAVVTVARTQLQWAIETIQWGTDTIQWVVSIVQKIKAAVPTAKVVGGSGLAEVIVHQVLSAVESGPESFGPGASRPASSGSSVSRPAVSGPQASGPGPSGPGTSGVAAVSGPPSSGPGPSGPGTSGVAALSGPPSSGPGPSGPGTSGPAVSGPASSGPAVSGPQASAPGPSGPSGTGISSPTSSGPVTSGPSGPTVSGPQASGPAVSGPQASAPGPSGPSGTGISSPTSSGPVTSGPSGPTVSGPQASGPAVSGPPSSGPGPSGPSGPAVSGPPSSGPGPSGPSGPAVSGPQASGPGPSGPSGPAVSGPPSSGPAVSGPPSSGPGPSGPSGPAVSSPPSSGPGHSGPSGPAVSGPPSSGPGPSGPSGPAVSGPSGPSGPAVSGPPSSGPGPSGPGTSEPAVSGPPSSGPGTSGPAVSGPPSSGPGPSGPSGPAVSGPPSSGPGPSGPSGPAVSGPPSSGPGHSGPSGPAVSGPPSSGPGPSGPSGPAVSGPPSSGPGPSGPSGPAVSGPPSSGPGHSGPSGPAVSGPPSSGPGPSGPSGPAVSGPPSSGPGPSGPSGPAVSGPPSSGPGPSGPGTSEPAVSGPPSSGPGPSGPAVSGPPSSGPGPSGPSGPAVSGPPSSGPGPSGPSGPAVSGPPSSGPGPSGPGTSEPAVSGPPSSGPGPSGPAVSGPPSSGPGPSGPSGPAVSGPPSSGPGPSGPSGPAVSGPPSSGPGHSGPSGPAVSGPPSSGPGPSGPSGPAVSGPPSSGPGPSGPSGPAVSGPPSSGPGPSGPGTSEPAVSGPPSSGPGTSGRAASGSAESSPAASGATGSGSRSTSSGAAGSAAAALARTAGAGVAAGALGGILGGLVAGARSESNGSIQKRKSEAQSAVMTDESLKTDESSLTDRSSQTDESPQTSIEPDSPENTQRDVTRNMIPEDSESNDSKGETKDDGPAGVSPGQHIQKKTDREKKLMVTKLSQCQYALPLLVPDPFTRQIEFPPWTFRQVNKSWKMRNINNEIIDQNQPMHKAETPMVFFFRFGSVSSSKSQLMNSLINEKHNTFFHRNCSGSSRTRVLMDGVVEITWYCPSGKNTDKFTDCVAFCNLHGDAGDHEKQLQILTEMSSVNVVLLPRLDRNDKHVAMIQNLYKDRKPLICLLNEDESTVTEMNNGKFKIGLKDRNQSDVSEELRRTINDCLSETSFTFRLEAVAKHPDIRVDEEDDEDCRRGREAAQQMMSLLGKKNLTEIKESFLPHQGKLWYQWCQKNKELHRPRGDEIEMEISRKYIELKEIREQQHKSKISEFIKFFIKEMNSEAANKVYFLKWLRILLDECRSADLSALHHKWSVAAKPKENHDESEELRAEHRISEELQAAGFGLEHIMREIGQIYESCSSVKENKKDLPVHFSSLPSLAAEMMISGSPLELMDGDAAHVPVIWISAVLDQLVQKLGDQRVFVLSVLGIQSSGKSTMLNAMFGLQFAVSAGRCTRGAFMQLVRVSDEMKTQMNTDYILVVDTEGLRALDMAGKSTRDHDNELATFVVGLANLTLINIFGENPSEMQDILQIVVQAFLRMKKLNLTPSCVFVHQNVSDITAGEKNMEGRRRLREMLDEMTKLTAKEEDCDAECFSDIIRFDVQKDVKCFTQLWEGSSPMAPLNTNYCENIQELKKTILSHAGKSHGMTLKGLKDRIKDLWEALLNERFSFRTALEISAYRKLETEYSKWSWSLHSDTMETENKLHNQIENEAIHEVEETDVRRELKMTSEDVKKFKSEVFEKDEVLLIHLKPSFDIKIKEVQESIVRETKKKLNEVHVNTLYEKSKELALKLKDKELKKETMRKEFDSFWKQYLNTIITDIPAIEHIDVMKDVRKILNDAYGSAPVDHWRDIFSVQSYSNYVQLKKSSGVIGGFTNAFRSAKEKLGYILSQEDETQIKSLVEDILQITEIQMFNISKKGYNISYIQTLTNYIMSRVIAHQRRPVKYAFKKEFFRDLVLSICKRMKEKITDQHRLFRDSNAPFIYIEKKKQEYSSIFQNYCHGATTAAIFGETICQKLKEPIEMNIYKKTARDLADEMKSECASLNRNRSNLEKHILETLAEEESFEKYIDYFDNPRDHFKSFIRDEVSIYVTDKFSVSVLPKMKENIELLQQKIMKAAHEATEHVQENSGDAGLWLKSFTQQLSDELIFSEKDLSGVKHDDADVDFKFLEDVIRKEISAITSDISNTDKYNTLDFKFRPDEILTDHFCQCCWVQCPFCGAVCTNTIENHDGDHSAPFHRVTGINGYHCFVSQNFCVDFCTHLVASDKDLYTVGGFLSYKEYRKAGGAYAKWSITPDCFELPYWKWFVCRFQEDLENHYKKKIKDEIPDQWKKLRKQDAIESLDKYF